MVFDFFVVRQGKVKQTWREEEDDELQQLFHQYRDNLDPGYFFCLYIVSTYKQNFQP